MKKPWTALLAALWLLLVPSAALANAAEPPSLTFYVREGPGQLALAVRVTDGQTAKEEALSPVTRPGARYYSWYGSLTPWVLENHYHMGPDASAVLLVRGPGISFDIPLDGVEGTGYSRLVTLDLQTGTLTPGERPLWWVAGKIAMRVGGTLLAEGALFWLFRYRKGRSWLTFLVVNLGTQAWLNVALFGTQVSTHMVTVFLLVFLEPAIFLAELIVLCVFVKEKKRWVTAVYSLLANLLSLAAGWTLIDLFPV